MRHIFSLKKLYLGTLGRLIPTDFFSQRHPVSVKGICWIDGRVVLVKNERREWDLPGGKLKHWETLADCLVREIREELNLEVRPGPLVEAIQVDVLEQVRVLVLVFLCHPISPGARLRLSGENFELGSFAPHELDGIPLPEAYRRLIRAALPGSPLPRVTVE